MKCIEEVRSEDNSFLKRVSYESSKKLIAHHLSLIIKKSMHPKHFMEHCPKCGEKQFEFQDFGAFECQSCQFQLYINASAAVAVFILNEKGELLLARRKFDPMAGTLDLPGGFVNTMETGEDAVHREIMEELNLTIDKLEYFGSFPNEYVFRGMSYFTLDLAYIGHVSDFTGLQANDDVSEVVFMKPLELDIDKEVGLSSIRQMLKTYQQYISVNKA